MKWHLTYAPTMASSEEFGRIVREARLAKGMSLGQLASAVGRSSSSVRRWERGEVAPAAAVLSKLEAILEIDPMILDAPVPTSEAGPDAGSAGVDVPEQRVSTVEQPVVAEASPRTAPPGSDAHASQTSNGGLFSDVWAALTRGDRSWIGWVRGLLTAVALILMIFALIWAIGELFDALREILDSFEVGSSGDPSP